MHKMRGFTLTELLIVLFVVAGGVGWIWNIVKIASSDFALTGMMVLRVVGIFIAPLGAIMGYIPA